MTRIVLIAARTEAVRRVELEDLLIRGLRFLAIEELSNPEKEGSYIGCFKPRGYFRLNEHKLGIEAAKRFLEIIDISGG